MADLCLNIRNNAAILQRESGGNRGGFLKIAAIADHFWPRVAASHVGYDS